MEKFKTRAMVQSEYKYSFSNSMQISSQCGLIGYLRADMDTDGNGFFSSWFDWREDLKTDKFKAEFDEIVNSLREDGNILHNRKALAAYCYSTPQARMETDMDYYGVRVDSEKYTYLFRLNPNKGEYNVYCYCYIKDWLNQHIRNAEKGIRFIDSGYKELFRIPDGGKICIRFSDGKKEERVCRYIDSYHVEIGSTLFHICEFAERMENAGNQVTPVKSLPEELVDFVKSYDPYGYADSLDVGETDEDAINRTKDDLADRESIRKIVDYLKGLLEEESESDWRGKITELLRKLNQLD